MAQSDFLSLFFTSYSALQCTNSVFVVFLKLDLCGSCWGQRFVYVPVFMRCAAVREHQLSIYCAMINILASCFLYFVAEFDYLDLTLQISTTSF